MGARKTGACDRVQHTRVLRVYAVCARPKSKRRQHRVAQRPAASSRQQRCNRTKFHNRNVLNGFSTASSDFHHSFAARVRVGALRFRIFDTTHKPPSDLTSRVSRNAFSVGGCGPGQIASRASRGALIKSCLAALSIAQRCPRGQHRWLYPSLGSQSAAVLPSKLAGRRKLRMSCGARSGGRSRRTPRARSTSATLR
jgi:hypothetical protein